ncbi:MAG: RDD family protein [Bacilli bacterium]|jgi:uncharacterized RDD family membrane protein YckC|nr:RDD family protein [Bacilli bacterium]
MNNSLIFKRIGAYLIDLLVITLFSMILTKISFINPRYEEYVEVSTKYNEMLNDYYEKKINITEFNSKVSKMSYDMNKSGYVYIIGDIAVIILYFGIYNFASKGKTLGKRIMNLQITSAKDKPLKIYNYLIRCILLNGIIMDIITLIAICFTKETYFEIYSIGSNFNMILQIIIFLSIMFSVNGRGLHDLIAGTKVINTKVSNEGLVKENKEEIKEEVEIIKPVKGDKKKEGTKSE